jgi:hypothetical protein
MQNLQTILLKNLQKQKLVKISSAELIKKIIEEFLKKKIKIVYKNQIIYVKNLPPNKKFELYIHKKQILEKIEKKFKKL